MDLQQHVPGLRTRTVVSPSSGWVSNHYTGSCCSDKNGTFGATKPPPNPPPPTSDDDYVEKDPKGRYIRMILYDTPGVIQKKMHKLDSMMMKNVRRAAVNADCVLVVVDACRAPQKIEDILEEGGVGELKDGVPTLLVLNKKDMIKPGEVAKKLEWYEKFTNVDEVIPVSAKYGHGVDDVKDWILSKLPLGPAYYPKLKPKSPVIVKQEKLNSK